MRTAIYGAGSLGTILGAYINKAGEPIELINRNKAHIEALQNSGAKVVGTVDFTQPVTAYTPAEMSGIYDIIFLMTKQQHNKEVVTMLKDFLAPDGVLVTFQNGLPEMLIADILGEERVLGCTVAWGATMKGPGVCELTSEPDALSFSLGSISARRSRHFAKVKELLEMMGTVDVEENFIGTRSAIFSNIERLSDEVVTGSLFADWRLASTGRALGSGTAASAVGVDGAG
jgi:2-dehydropantoate 2-reductase